VDSGLEAKINIPVLVINVALLTVQTTQSQSGQSHQRSALAHCPSFTKMNKSKDGRINQQHSYGIWRRDLDFAGFCWIRTLMCEDGTGNIALGAQMVRLL
jgi:hypothetical protein